MKKPHRILCAATLTILLAGCALFDAPSAKRTHQNEQSARNAESKTPENERERAISSRAKQYERQGLSATEARAAAEGEVPGMLPRH